MMGREYFYNNKKLQGVSLNIFRVVLPVPPTANNLFPSNKAGRRFPSEAYKEWKNRAGTYFEDQDHEVPKLKGKIAARYSFRFPDKRRRDIANFEKAVTDFLVSRGVIDDDCNIDQLILFRLDGDIQPGVYIEMSQIQ